MVFKKRKGDDGATDSPVGWEKVVVPKYMDLELAEALLDEGNPVGAGEVF